MVVKSFYESDNGTKVAFTYDNITESGAFRFTFSDGTKYYGRTISQRNAHRVKNQMETFKALNLIEKLYKAA